jgi:hypothetical protein
MANDSTLDDHEPVSRDFLARLRILDEHRDTHRLGVDWRLFAGRRKRPHDLGAAALAA